MNVAEFFKVRGKNLYVKTRESDDYWSFEIKYSTDPKEEEDSKILGRKILSIKEYSNLIESIFPLLKEDIYRECNLRYACRSICLGKDLTNFFLFEGLPYEVHTFTFFLYKYKLDYIKQKENYLTKDDILKKLEIFRV